MFICIHTLDTLDAHTMAYELFDLSHVISRMECTKGIMFNGREIVSCFPKCGYETKEIYDEEYWEDPFRYNILLHSQFLLGFPLIKKELPTTSSAALSVELAKARYELFDINNYIQEYKKMYHIGLMAKLPMTVLNNACSYDTFEYFNTDPENNEVKFKLPDHNVVTLKVTPDVFKSFIIIEDVLGQQNAMNQQNKKYFDLLPVPSDLEEISKEYSLNKNIKFSKKVAKVNETIFQEYRARMRFDTDTLL